MNTSVPRPCYASDHFYHIKSTHDPQTLVKAALPAAFFAAPKSSTGMAVELDKDYADAKWWLKHLAEDTDETGGARSVDADACTYTTDEVPEWLPISLECADDVEVDGDEYEKASAAGITISCRRFHGDTPEAATATANTKLGMELEAAVLGVAPPVFASFVVTDAHDPAGGSCAVVISARHCFTLRQLFVAHSVGLADPIARARVPTETIENTIYESTASLARRMRLLTRRRKSAMVNLSVDNVVFVPRLVLDDSGLQATGYGFVDVDGGEVVPGVPMVTGFDSTHMHRVGSGCEVHDEDMAYASSMAVLVRQVRSEFPLSHKLLRNKLCGKTIEGRMLPETELPELFDENVSLPAALKRAFDRSGEVSLDAQCATATASALGAADADAQSILLRAEKVVTTEVSATTAADALSEVQAVRELERSIDAAAKHASKQYVD